jgi:hypothetical protein
MLRCAAIVAVLLGICVSVAVAHDVRGTVVLLDLGETLVAAEVQLPASELRAALKLPRADDGNSALPAGDQLGEYVRMHLSARTRGGEPFSVEVSSVGQRRVDDGDAIVARVELRAPRGESARVFVLNSDLIVHEVMTHNTYMFVRRDLATGLVDDEPQLLGMMHFQNKQLAIDRSSGTLWQGFRATFQLGMRHISEGADHLMFLIVLLLPAPLLAQGRRWQAPAGLRTSALQIAKIVTAFTVGHSLTLLLGCLGIASLHERLVEVLIAFSILVSAIHAVTPLFARREAWVAGGFGLVHGLAFASVLSGLAVDRTTLVVSVLSFNLGIEAMQLAIVALTMPFIYLMSRGPLYKWFRSTAAVLAAVASLAWVAERGLTIQTPISKWVEQSLAHGRWWLLGLAVIAALSQLLRPRAPTMSA